MKNKPIKLTPQLLRRIIEQEVKGFGAVEDVEDRADDTDEVDADGLADTVENNVDWQKAGGIKESTTLDGHIDYMKALKLEETRLTRRLGMVRSALQKGAKKFVVSRVV